MGIIAKPLGVLLTLIYKLVGNYGISLIILTAIVRCALYPLYVKQIKATSGMSTMQPRVQEIQRKYANDKQKMNEELNKLYRESNFNPLGGCLPLVIQMPIIFGLFALLRNPMKYLDDNMVTAAHESFLWIKDLAQPDLWILPILAGVGTFFAFTMTQQLTMAGNQQAATMNRIMKFIFPISILWLARAYPAGLAIYWAGGQFLQIFFNWRMNKIRKEINDKTEKEKLVIEAEKILEKKRCARLSKVKGK